MPATMAAFKEVHRRPQGRPVDASAQSPLECQLYKMNVSATA
jgi:hypothetical protein